MSKKDKEKKKQRVNVKKRINKKQRQSKSFRIFCKSLDIGEWLIRLVVRYLVFILLILPFIEFFHLLNFVVFFLFLLACFFTLALHICFWSFLCPLFGIFLKYIFDNAEEERRLSFRKICFVFPVSSFGHKKNSFLIISSLY